MKKNLKLRLIAFTILFFIVSCAKNELSPLEGNKNSPNQQSEKLTNNSLISSSIIAPPPVGPIVKSIIAENLGVRLEQVTDEASLAKDLGADDLNIVEIIHDLEQEFHITIFDEDVERLITVKNYTEYVLHYLKDVTITAPGGGGGGGYTGPPIVIGGGGSGNGTGGNGTGSAGDGTVEGGGGGGGGGGVSGGSKTTSSVTFEETETTGIPNSNPAKITYSAQLHCSAYIGSGTPVAIVESVSNMSMTVVNGDRKSVV